MLYNRQTKSNQQKYIEMLRSTGALSNLFSESDAPYLVSRNVENTYCVALQADNLGRADCSADASLDGVGVGLKTFLHGNGRTLQKVAEFNKDSKLYRDKSPKEMIITVAQLRNQRIEFTKRTYGLHDMIYHCVTRKPGNISLFEVPMDLIDIQNIKNITVSNKNIITFQDGINEYSFNVTKSTLYKRFYMENPLAEIDVQIIKDPYTTLAQLFNLNNNYIQSSPTTSKLSNKEREFIVLPLFSDRGAKRHVPEKSGLNQWNAAGRLRNPNEVYIPIPVWIHKVFPTFFPPRDESFDLSLPDKAILSAKVCQENSKALMSNPNSALGEWLLRKVMDLKEKELLTYEKLETLGIDSVAVYKHGDTDYSIDFCEIGTYDEFIEKHQ
ncbi:MULTISPECIES: restriction endonuclease PLD domain-containing protein [Bacillus cereus group]|uniref:restriction endonuclease PLD domain-containing protein n=1 Tax=Bacillus cereus group TaxID=86661 RepID=UPI0029C138E8|nr:MULTISPECIES: restriction endonuclease PLD domain-containing protein [Bacillus cereus group]MDX5883525.1 NgoFVII family restriction endonuclease [Bacillus cereus group sp. BfR-BA-00999]